MTSLDAARDALGELAKLWPLLAETRIPGTALPWRPPELSPEQRAERDREAYADRFDDDVIGWTKAPLHLGVVDALTDLAANLDELADVLARETGAVPPVPASALADPRPLLAWCQDELSVVREARVVAWAGERARAMVEAVNGRVSDVWDGMRLPIVCPWCRGVTPYAPAGGAHTWRVRLLPGSPEKVPAIVCEGECEPPHRDVGTWWRGKPCWPIHEFEWLARRVEAAEEVA